MMERIIPTDIGSEMPINERKEVIYEGEHVSVTYYPDRMKVLMDKILFPINILRHKYIKRKYGIVLGRKGFGKVRSYIKPIDANETDD